MKKYQPLMEYLENCGQERITLSYKEIEKIIGDTLPKKSSYYHRAWWSNDNTHTQSAAWLDAGYKTSDVTLGISVTFEKI